MEVVRIEFPIKTTTAYSEEVAVSAMVEGLKKLIEFGALKGNIDSFVQNYEVSNPGGFAVAIIDKTALVDASKLSSVGASLSFPVDLPTEEIKLEDRKFSAATIQERLRLNGLDPKIKFRATLLDYKKYYKANESKLTKNPVILNRLKNMFLVDMMGIFNDVLPYIKEGKQLSTLTGLSTLTDGLNNISKDLSLAYRKALQQAKGGQISRSVFQSLQVKYAQFMNTLIPQVFPGIDKVDLTEAQKTHSESRNGVVSIETTNPKVITELVEWIQKIGNGGHSFTIVVDPDNKDYQKKFEWDGDGSDKISKVSMIESDKKSYSMTSDGRIKLFDDDVEV